MLIATKELVPDSRPISGWVNTNLYKRTSEVFGILPIPDSIRTSSGMQQFISGVDDGSRHNYLARRLGTRKAVLPLHSAAEYSLFRTLMQEDPLFNPRDREPDWSKAVKVWNRRAETSQNIYYKVCYT